MHANYPKSLNQVHWDPVHLKYPVHKFPETGISSETIARQLRSVPETLKTRRIPTCATKHYDTDHILRKDIVRSQTATDFSNKTPETKIFNKHTSCMSNEYIYPPPKNLIDRVPALRAHGVTEMRDAYTTPIVYSRLATDKDQFKNQPSERTHEPILVKEIEPLYTTYEGFEKYLDPYLTTSRLHHQPFTAAQTDRPANKKDVVTYHTLSKTPWVRSQKPRDDEWRVRLSCARSIYDREKFKDEFREIRTHNTPQWVPGGFRTEVRDNYAPRSYQLESNIYNNEDLIQNLYSKSIAGLETNKECEQSSNTYSTENSQVGSGKPLCAVFDPYVNKNKRRNRKCTK